MPNWHPWKPPVSIYSQNKQHNFPHTTPPTWHLNRTGRSGSGGGEREKVLHSLHIQSLGWLPVRVPIISGVILMWTPIHQKNGPRPPAYFTQDRNDFRLYYPALDLNQWFRGELFPSATQSSKGIFQTFRSQSIFHKPKMHIAVPENTVSSPWSGRCAHFTGSVMKFTYVSKINTVPLVHILVYSPACAFTSHTVSRTKLASS